MQFLINFLAPVPLALFGLFVGALACDYPFVVSELPDMIAFGLGSGYLSMGLQSALFALAMRWLKKRGLRPVTRGMVAGLAGGLAGASLFLVPLFVPVLLFAVLGASVGLATLLLAELGTSASRGRSRRYFGARLLLLLVVPSLGGAVGAIVQDCWADAARRGVLAGVSLGMRFGEVERLVGAPTHDSRDRGVFIPTETVDVVWKYDCEDPGSAALLVISLSFKNERVVEIDRKQVWR